MTKKRVFGTDISNISFKRNKTDLPAGQEANLQVKLENVESEFYSIHGEQNQKPRSYQYGPFAPVTVAKAGVVEQKNSKPVHDIESLTSSYAPQYHNQGTM